LNRVMRILLTADPDNYLGASRQTLRDIESISERFGFEKVHLGNYKHALAYLGLALSRKRHEHVLVAYPYYCRPVHNRLRGVELKLLRKAARSGKTIAYVVDLPIEQYEAAGKKELIDRKAREAEGKFFRTVDKVLVFNDAMAQALISNYDVPEDRFVKFELLDYTVEQPPFSEKGLDGRLHVGYAGSLNEAYVKELSRSLTMTGGLELDLFGKAGEWIDGLKGNAVHHHGEFDSAEIVKELASRCHFGMIIRGEDDRSWDAYHEYTSTSKFSSYMVSGVPVLVPYKYHYISSLVRKYDVGLSFNSLESIPILIRSLDENRYRVMRRNAYSLGKKMAAGCFLTEGLATALDEKMVTNVSLL